MTIGNLNGNSIINIANEQTGSIHLLVTDHQQHTGRPTQQ